MEISIESEAQFGMTWPRWQALIKQVEAAGFAGLFRSDHFTIQNAPPDQDALELIVSLTYLAANTQRVHFGPLVAPVSMRDPIMLARQASQLDDLSGGRMILGIGAGWNAREHQMFGYPLSSDNATRFARLQEALEVITLLLRGEGYVSFAGRFYQLKEAALFPRPTRPGGPRILIGGSGPKRTLPLAARYADIWNGDSLSPAGFGERSARLDDAALKIGRDPKTIKRTNSVFVLCARTPEEFERRAAGYRRFVAEFARLSWEEIGHKLRTEWSALVGTPAEVVEQVNALAEAGVEELMLHWVDTADSEALDLFVEQVLPHAR
ncbi:MAG: TIGR03560 family F420-dependent LLM class oxidoreductase [Anaerolineales bacterium]|nr:TIGR03560 family F420-dependent LLM class oxidoreductase [Anaerolineales bacterium]